MIDDVAGVVLALVGPLAGLGTDGLSAARRVPPAPRDRDRGGDLSAIRVAASPAPVVEDDAQPSWRSMLAGPLVAVITLAGATWRPTHRASSSATPTASRRAARRGSVILVLVLVAMDVFVRAARRAPRKLPPWAVLAEVRAERWGWRRGLAVGSALVSFYITYLAYRNLKSAVPLLRPDDLVDRQLADLDRALFLGSDPAELAHAIFGTGAAAEVLSVIYLFYVLFVPISLAVALVFSANLPGGMFYATAAAINWPIGALSYIALPALGPSTTCRRTSATFRSPGCPSCRS